ncbi:MAG: signal peptidase I [Lentisphaerae bacterium]|nr:signal peptidase I [Lentisphaerota bacterium]
MFAWLKKDHSREQARDLLRHARHFRRMREDVMAPARVRELIEREQAVAAALGEGTRDTVTAASHALQDWLGRNMPARRFPGVREHLEILVVAVGVAMACRTYFIQPFKIPTGSMQPTLYGIIYEPRDTVTWMDRLPFKLVKWVVFGEWFTEVRTQESGYATMTADMNDLSNGHVSVIVGSHRYRIPSRAPLRLSPNQFLPKGTVLWRGVRVAGDHVFVDRVRWNVSAPRRGQIVVFNTDDIPTLPPKTHYIKRLVGLPNELVSIEPPNLVINGAVTSNPKPIARIENQEPGYAGYRLVDPKTDSEPLQWAMRRSTDVLNLGPDDFFALGDNTQNSRDGRYWGSVPRRNLVGPAVFVYWPFSRRWGLAD